MPVPAVAVALCVLLTVTGCVRDKGCGRNQLLDAASWVCVCIPNAVASEQGGCECEVKAEDGQAKAPVDGVCEQPPEPPPAPEPPMMGDAGEDGGGEPAFSGECVDVSAGASCSSSADCSGAFDHCAVGDNGSGYCSKSGCTADAECCGDSGRCKPAFENKPSYCQVVPSGLDVEVLCSSDADCEGLDADYCETFQANLCIQTCDSGTTPSGCAPDYICCGVALASLYFCIPEEQKDAVLAEDTSGLLECP